MRRSGTYTIDRGADLEQQLSELSAAVAARDSFIALVGHELRNAVAPLVLLAEQFAALSGQSPALASRVVLLHRHLERFVKTIDRVAEVADVRRGKLQLARQPVDLVEVVDEVCREAGREAAAGGARLVVDASGPVVGQWDRGRVKQIVSNLVSNALRYGGGEIELRVRPRGSAGELVVRDHGPGIAPALLPRLFDRFDHVGSGRAGGLGIGLWLVKSLCAAMQGSVTAENCTSGGASFCVALPRG